MLSGCSPTPSARDVSSSGTEQKGGILTTGGRPDQESGTKVTVLKPVEPPLNPLVSPTQEQGILRGEVVWKGAIPTATAKSEECFVDRNGGKVAVTPPLPVSVDATTGGVADVMVWLTKPPAKSEPPVPSSVRLMQSNGVFRQAAQFVPPGTILRLRTTDDGADFQGSGTVRFSKFLRRGEAGQVTLDRPGLVTIRSASHPWMTPAHVRVLEHEYHAITGTDGKCDLPRLPTGEYQVVLWHGTAGTDCTPVQTTARVKIDDKSGAKIRWTLPRE